MDPNANAVEPAVVTPASEPAVAPSEATTPQVNGDVQAAPSFDEATQKYLDNQNIKGTTNEIVAELVRRNQSFRNGQQTIKETLNPTPSAETPVQPQQTVQSSQTPQRQLSDLEIASVSMYVQNQYKDVTVDAQFYKDMIADGFQPMKSDGTISLDNVVKYASFKDKLARAEQAIQAAPIPSPSNAIETSAPIEQMTETAAQNIIIESTREARYGRPRHPQYDQAVEFIQNLARKK